MSLKDAIKEAAKSLDHKKVDDWQEDGRPSLKRIHQLAKSTAITQEQLDDALPDLRRNQTSGAPATPTPQAAQTRAVVSPAAAPAKAAVPKGDPRTEAIRKASDPKEAEAHTSGKDAKYVENTLVVALEEGYFASKLREPGETFYFTGRLGKWMEVADKADRKEHAEERAADA